MFRTSLFTLVFLIAACTANPPLIMTTMGAGEVCTMSVNGTLIAEHEFKQLPFQRLSKAHGGRIIVDTGGDTPYRCIGSAVFHLQRAGFRFVKVQVDGVDLPSR